MKVLITGGSSYLGQHLVPMGIASSEFDIAYTFFNNDPLGLPQGVRLDLRDEVGVADFVDTFRPDVIIHAAVSNRSMKGQPRVIEQSADNLLSAAKTVNARFIHLSTDVLFAGDAAPYKESDPPSPLHDYGKAKAFTEKLVSQYNNHVIIRTSLIYGLEIMDRGTEWAIGELKQGNEITLFSNSLRNPVWVENLSAVCFELCTHPYNGVLHVAGGQVQTRAQFARKLLHYWHAPNIHLAKDGPSLSPTNPLDCRLDNTLAQTLLKTPLLGVDEVLAQNKSTLP